MYKILNAQYIVSLEKQVKEAIEDYWELVGGPFVDRHGNYCQAVRRNAHR